MKSREMRLRKKLVPKNSVRFSKTPNNNELRRRKIWITWAILRDGWCWHFSIKPMKESKRMSHKKCPTMTKYSNYINYKQIWVRYEARKNGETLYILLNSNGNRIDNHFFLFLWKQQPNNLDMMSVAHFHNIFRSRIEWHARLKPCRL